MGPYVMPISFTGYFEALLNPKETLNKKNLNEEKLTKEVQTTVIPMLLSLIESANKTLDLYGSMNKNLNMTVIGNQYSPDRLILQPIKTVIIDLEGLKSDLFEQVIDFEKKYGNEEKLLFKAVLSYVNRYAALFGAQAVKEAGSSIPIIINALWYCVIPQKQETIFTSLIQTFPSLQIVPNTTIILLSDRDISLKINKMIQMVKQEDAISVVNALLTQNKENLKYIESSDMICYAVKADPKLFDVISSEQKKKMYKQLVEVNIDFFKELPEARRDLMVSLFVVKKNGALLKYIAPDIREQNTMIIIEAIKNNKEAFDFCSDKEKEQPETYKKLIEIDVNFFAKLPAAQKDPIVALSVVQNNGMLLQNVDKKIQEKHPEIIIAALIQDKSAISFCDPAILKKIPGDNLADLPDEVLITVKNKIKGIKTDSELGLSKLSMHSSLKTEFSTTSTKPENDNFSGTQKSCK